MEAEIKVTLKGLEEKVDRLIRAVLGNGSDGMLIRVDRIEQKEKNRKDLAIRMDRLERRAAWQNRFIWTIGGGTFLALITAVFTVIFQ